MRRTGRHAALTAGLWLGSSALARAQCVMCSLAAQNASDPQTVSRTFAAAILVLLVPTLGLLGGFALLLRRSRG